MNSTLITEDILIKNGFQKRIINGYNHFYFGKKEESINIYKDNGGKFYYSNIGINSEVKFISDINEYYRKRTGEDIKP
ncbi:MAG: hypothetical protein ABI388_07495 [Bacteroidia bacterium]